MKPYADAPEAIREAFVAGDLDLSYRAYGCELPV